MTVSCQLIFSLLLTNTQPKRNLVNPDLEPQCVNILKLTFNRLTSVVIIAQRLS